MPLTQKISLRTLLLIAILAGGLFDGLGLAGIIDVWAFSRQWGESWGSDHRGDWDEYKIGDCGGQNHSVSGGVLHMDASYGTDCFGAYYRENGNYPGMFPRNQDIRVMWRWRYPDREKYGTQAGQLTGRYGGPQYYGMSAVDTGSSGNTNDSWHVVTQGPWGTQTVDNSPKYGTDTGWHVSTFDWLCDGAVMKWWLDDDNFQTKSSSSYALPADHESRPWQFWQGNLMTGVPGSGSWTPFDIDYLQIYAVERPQLNTPTSGGGGVQMVSWNSVPNSTQPDGTAWGVQYQVQACNNSSCSSIQQSSPWLDGASYTFTGLPLNQTYTYRARARWLGAPGLETCWGNTVSASMTGAPELELSQLAPAQVEYGDTIIYSLTVKNTGDAPATGVVVTDSPPAHARLPGSSPSPGSPMAVQVFNGGSYSSGQLSWQIGALAPGQRVTVSWWTGLEAAVPTSVNQIINTPRATADGGLSVTAPATTQVLHPNISLTKSGPATSFPGDTITYQIEIENTGPGRALESWIFDTTAAGFDKPNGDLKNVHDISHGGFYIDVIDEIDTVSFSAVCADPQDQTWYIVSYKPTLVWSLDRLEAGEKQTLTFSADVDPTMTGGSSIDNKAQFCYWHTGPEPDQLVSTPLIAPQLTLSKSGPAEIWVGDRFSYQITARNSGSVPVVDPVTTDPIPQYIINPANFSGSLNDEILTWPSPGWLEPGQSLTLDWDFEVDPATPPEVTGITNQAVTRAAGGLNEQAQTVSALLFAVMELSKSATPVVYPGAPISYTIRVANSGAPAMQQVVITDTIPRYVTGISGISHGGRVEGSSIVWRLPDQIAGGSQLDLSWHGQIDPNIPRYETEITNRVAGTALATGDTAETRSTLTYPQMTLTKSGPASTSPGQPLEYTIVVENSGDAPMLDVLIRDPIPAHLLNVDVPAGTLTGGVASWEFSRLEPGERQELVWRATVAPDIPDNISLILNRASGTALGGIEERAEAAASLQFPLLTLDKQAPAEVWPGGQIEYTIHIENSGVVALEELVISDFIPDYVLDPVDISHGGLVDGQEIVWQLGDLAPGAAYDLTWRGTVDPAIPQARRVIRNQVQGRAAHGVSRVSEATSLVLFPALVVGKQGPAQAGPGDPVQYVIEVHNASAAPVDGVVVVDHIPEYIIEPGSISGGGRVEGADIIWELGRLGGGQSRTLLWEGSIDGAVPLGRSYLDNTVTVCDESGRFCDEALYRMPLLQADARLTKAATPYGHPGSEVEYVIRLQNSGETDLEELVISDPLPAYIEYPHDISAGGQALPSPFEDEIAVVWRLEQLAVGQIVELRWRGRIALDTPPAVDAIQNRVTVTDRRGLQREAAGSTYVMHPQLRLRQQATPQAGPGETVDYTLSLENPGQVPAYELELVDLIPAHILTPTQVSGGGLLQADEISWRFAELAAGQVVSLTWQGTVDPQIPAAVEQIANTAQVSNPAGLLAEDTALTDLSGQLLALRKTATAMVEPGGEVLYELEIENRGQAAVTGLSLTDPIPAYVESPAEISGGGSAANNVAVSWEIERLEAGQTYRVGWQGVVARDIPAKESEILNEARLTSASGLALTAQARSLVQQPRLALDKSATLTAGPGEVITTVLTVRNLGGGTAYDVAVSDPLPAYLTAESSGPGVELAADRVTWALVGGLLPGASRSLTWTGRVDPHIPVGQTEIVNEATATDSGGQLAAARAVTGLKTQQVSLRKDASEVVSPGGSVVYTITVENRGQAALYDVVLIDPMPETVRDARDISGGGKLAGNDRLRWELPRLAPGQLISVTWRGTVVEDLADTVHTLWNEASLESGSGLAAEARAKSLVRRPLLTLEKTATPLAGPGELIYYVLTVRNRGEAPAYEATVADPLPAYLEFVSVSEGGQDQGDAVSWTVTDLAPGETVTLDWYGRVARDVPAALTEITNQATLETPNGSQAEAMAVTRLKRQQVQLVKQAPAQLYAGGPVSYTLTVENRGEAVLYNLALADPLPAFVQDAQIVAAGGGAAQVNGNQTVAWDIPALAAGKGLTLTWAGTVGRDVPAKETEIVNEASLMSASGLSAQAQARSRLAQPLLMLDKSAPLAAGPGERIVYTLTLRNQGSAPAYDVELLDPVPDYLEQVTSPDGEVRAEAIRWRFDQLAAGESKGLTWSAFVAEDVPVEVAEIVNVASVRDGAGRAVEATAVTNLIQPGAPLVSKAATYETYPSGVVSYTITLRNPGQAVLFDLIVTDPIPEYVEAPSAVSSGGSAADGFEVIWQIDRLETGQTLNLSWQGTVARDIPAKETEIVNQVVVETANGLRRTAQARSFVRQPQLTLDKTATLEAGPEQSVAYTLTLANRGLAPAYEVELLDPIPDHLERAASPDGQVQAEAIRWRFAELPDGAVETLTWSAFVAEDVPVELAEIINLAVVRDGAGREVEAAAVTNLIQPDAPIVSKAATYEIYPGGVVSYTITVRNPGQAALFDVVVTDPIPDYVENSTAISSGGSAAGGFEVVWQIDRLEAGQILSLTWQGTVARDIPAKETEITNQVTVETANGLRRTAQARSFVRQPQLTLDKTATLEVGPGGRIDYNLTLANQGLAPAYDVELLDPIPEYLEQANSPDGEVQAEAVRWRFTELPAGAVETLTWSAFVAQDIPPDVAEIVNLAAGRDGAGREVEASAVTNLIQPGAPLVTMAATYDVYPGGVVSYTISLRNPGGAALYDVTVTDPIPEYVENPTAVSGGGQIEGNNALVWQLDQVAAGETVNLAWQGDVARDIPTQETEIVNEVAVEMANGLRRTAQARSFVRQPQLTLDKTATLEAGPGGRIDYTLTLANRGLAPAYDIELLDPIPDYVERAASPDGQVQADAIRWRFEELAAGETHTLTWSAFVVEDIPPDVAEIVNLAVARDGAGREVEASAVTNLIQPGAPLVTTAATYDVYPGGVVSYTISLRNPGGAALYDVTVTDPIPEYVENPTAVSSGGSAAGGFEVVWQIDRLEAGETVSLAWQGTVAASIPAKETEITNQVTVETANGLRRTAQARSFVRQPQLTLDKMATFEIGPGGRVEYTLTLANQGLAPAYQIELLDPIPDYLERTASPDGEIRPDAVRWRFAALPAGAVETLTWSAFVAEDVPVELAEIVNVAAVRDGAGRLVEASAVTNLIQPDAPLLLQEATYRIYPGGVVSYTISLHNDSPQALYDLTVRHPVPAHILEPTALSAGGRLEGNTAVVWELAALAPGETAHLGWQGQVARDIPTGVDEITSRVTVETASGLRSAAQAVSFVQRPRLLITLAATLSAGPGDMIEYILQIGNPGQAPAYDVEVQNPIPAYILGAASLGGEVQADAVHWRFAEMPAGAVETLTWSGFVDPDIPATLEQIVSTAAIAGAAGNRAEATAVTGLPAQAISLRQAASYEVYPGGTVAYTLTVQNRSQSRLSQIAVRQPVPAYVLAPTAISHDGFLDGNLAVVWELASLASGAAETLTWQGTVDPAAPANETALLGEATLASGSGLSAQAQAKSWLRRPQLLLRPAGPAQAAPGDRLDYVLTLENSGQAPAYNVEIRNPLPDQVSAPTSPDGAVLGDAIIWQLDRLEPGEQRVLSWQGEIARDVPASLTEITNSATAHDQAGRQVEVQVVTRLIQPELWLAKAAPLRLSPGGTAVYTLTVSNPGQVPLYDLTVSDPLPAAIVPPLAVADGGQLQGASLIWQLPVLAPGERRDLHWSAGVDPGLPETEPYLRNEATATAGGGLTARAEARSWLARPLLRLDKLATPESGTGGPVVYTLTVRNDGLAPAYGVTVTDPLPDYVEQAASPDGQVQAEAIRWQFDELAAGQSKTLTWQGTIQADVPPGLTEIINQATATDASSSEVTAQAATRLLPQRLDLVQAATLRSYPGGPLVYTLTVTNRGAAEVANVTVRSPIPSGVIDPAGISDEGRLEGNLAIAWELDTLPAGQSRVLTWQGTVDPALSTAVTAIRSEASVETVGGLADYAETHTWLTRPLLRLDKLATPESGAGGPVVYTLTVRNDGQAPAYGVTVSDPLPDYVVDPTAAGEAVIQAEAIRWQFDELAAGQSKSLTWQGVVQADAPASLAEIVNRATATDAAGSEATAQAATRLLPQRLDLVQAATYQSYPGGPLVYTLTLTNRGAAGLANVTVRNPIPDGVINPTDISGEGQLEGNLAVVWELDTLPAGQSQTFSWQGTVDPALSTAVTSLRSEATATTAGGLDERAETRTWLRRPLLRLDKLAMPESGAGGPLVYTLTVRNDGLAPAYGVTVTDPLPDYVVEPTAAGEAVVQAEAIRWQFDELAAGESKSLTWQGTVQADAPVSLAEIINQATATDAAGSEVTAQATTRLLSQKLDLAQAATYQSYPGGSLVYTLTVTNRGAAEVANVTVRNPIPDGVIDPAGISNGGHIEGNLAVVWELDTLPAGQSWVLTWQGTVDPALSTAVTAIRSEASVETVGGLVDYAEIHTWLTRPLLRLDKLAMPESGAGGPLVYTLTVRNNGLAPAYEVTVTDPIPNYVEQVVSPDGQIQAEAIRWQVAELAAGESKSLTWQGAVQVDAPANLAEIVNQATATDAAGSEVTAQATTRLLPQQLDLTQAATYQSYPGGPLVYTLTVTNRGAAGLAGVTVRNPIPDGVIDPAGISSGGQLEGNLAVVWELDTLAVGQSQVLAWQGTVDPTLPIAVTNLRSEATAETSGGLRVRAEARTLLRQPTLALDYVATREAGPGEPVLYRIMVKNSGQVPAYEVTVTDPIPAYLTNPTGAESGEIRTEAVVWRLDRLAVGESKTLSWQGTVAEDIPAGQSQLASTVTAGRGDEPLSAQTTTWLKAQAVSLVIAAGDPVYPGAAVTYTLIAKNEGQATLYDVRLRNPLPANVRYLSGGQIDGNEVVTWQLPRLAAGEVVSLTWQGSLAADLPTQVTVIRNEASLTTAGGLTAHAQATSLVAQPRLRLDQTAPFEVGPGEVITYALTVRNLGPAPAYDLRVENPLPAHIIDPAGLSNGGRSAGNLALLWELDSLAAGQSQTLTWRGAVDPAVPERTGQILNRAMVEDAAGLSDEAQAVTTLVRREIDLSGAASLRSYPGGPLVYTLTVRNPGQAAVDDITVTNPLPDYVAEPVSAGGQVAGNRAVTWQIPRLAPGESLALGWQAEAVRTTPRDVTEIQSVASLVTGSGLTARAEMRTLIQHPALLLEKWASREAGPGEMVDYLLTLRNVGQAPAYDMILTDPIPAYVVRPTGALSGEIRAEAVVWRLAVLPAGQRRTFTWQGTLAETVPDEVRQVGSAASVRDRGGDQVEAEALTWLRRQGVTLLKAASPHLYPGGTAAFTLTVENPGDTALYEITVSDPIPDHILAPAAVSEGGQIVGNEVILWRLPGLAAGEQTRLTWQGNVAKNVPAGVSQLGSDASLTAGGGLEAKAGATSRIDRPRLTLDSLATPQTGPGETVVYTLTVANPSQAPAYAVEVRQPIPDHIVNPITSSGNVQADAVTWRLAELSAGETQVLTWQGRVEPAIPAKLTQIDSMATAKAAAGQSASSSAATALAMQRLHLAQNATDTAGPGSTVAYTMTLRNLGQAALYDLTVTSPVPNHVLAPTAISNGGQLAGSSGLRWEVVRLAAGQVLTLSWQGTVDPALPADQTQIQSTASVSTRSGLAAAAQAHTRLLRPSLRLAALAPATVGPGDLISYTILVENVGQVPAIDLELHDPIPAAIREPGAISGAGFVDHLPVYGLRWKLGDLGPDQRRTVSWQGRVAPQPLTGTTRLTSSVIAQAAGGVSAEALAQTRLLRPRFELAALATPQAGPGETVVYTLVLTNTGQIPVRELLVAQPLPDHLTPLETNGALRESDPLGHPLLRWALPSLAVGETRVITWRGRIDLSVPPALGWLDSRVTAAASSAGERQATAATRLRRPRLSLAKRVSPPHVAAGDSLTYTLLVTNTGPVNLFDVTLTDLPPDHLTPLAVDDERDGNGILRWQLGDLEPGEVRQVTWQGQLTAAAPLDLAELRSQVVVTAAAGVQATAWGSAVVRQPALALSITGPAWVQPGETVRYGVTLTNTGQAVASGVRLTDTLPLSTTLLEAPGGVISDGVVVWEVGDLAVGQQQAVSLQVRLDPDLLPGPVLNRAAASAARGLTAEADSVAAVRQPLLRLSQQAAGLASAGGRLTYTLRLRNGGAGLARTVVLTNPLPAHLDFVSASPPATLTGRILRWQPGLLPAGAGFEARWTGRLALALPETAAAITNTAWAASPDLARPVTATAVLPTLPPQVSAQLVCPPAGQVGDVMSYTMRLHNRGGTLLTPTLALTLPPGTAYVPASATLGGRLETGRRDVWGSPLPDQVQWRLPPLYPGDRLQPQLALTITTALSDVVWAEAELVSHGGSEAAHFGCLTALHPPRLALAKRGPERALVGDITEWQLTLTNTGQVTAYRPLLTDTLPPGLTYVPGSASQAAVLTRTHPGGGWPETVLVWQAADLAPGESLVRTFRTTVTLPLDLAGYPLAFNAQNEAALENRAVAAADGAEPVTASHLTLVPRPALTLTRQAAVETGLEAVLYDLQTGGDISLAGPAAQPLRLTALSGPDEPPVAVAAVQAWPGSRIRHTLRGANLGPGLARQAWLLEHIPAGLEVLTGTISAGGQYDPLERTITWALGDLIEGEQLERSYTLAVPLSLRPDLAILAHNRAELMAVEAPTVFASAATTLDDDLTLAVVKSGPATTAPGAELAYTIRVQNVNRSPLDQVTITDPLPDYTRYLTGSASLPPEIQAEGRTLRWNLGMLPAGALAEVRFKVQVDEDLPDWVLQLHNRAAVTWTGGGPVTAETTSRLPGAALPPTPTPTTTAPPPAPPGDDGDSGVAPPPPPPPMETPILRTTAVVSPLVTATPTLTPTDVPVRATATPRPQPLLRKAVSPDTVLAGELTVLTWQLTFSNPTPLTIVDLLVRDLLPPGLLYLEAETSRGIVEVSPRSIYGRRARPGVTITPGLTPRATRPNYLTAEQARLVIRPTAAASDTLPSPTARVYTVLPAETITAATMTPVWPGLDPADLPGAADVPPTEVLFRLGNLPPGGRVRMTIRTLVLTDARAGTRYDNVATFAAANMDPGISNRVPVRVVSDELRFILPVTGGLLALIDPRTSSGQVVWLLVLIGGGLLWYRRQKR